MRKQDPTSSHQHRTRSAWSGCQFMAGTPSGSWSWESQQGSPTTNGWDRTWNHKAWQQHPRPTPIVWTVKSQELINFVSNALPVWPRPTVGCFSLLSQLRLRPGLLSFHLNETCFILTLIRPWPLSWVSQGPGSPWPLWRQGQSRCGSDPGTEIWLPQGVSFTKNSMNSSLMTLV